MTTFNALRGIVVSGCLAMSLAPAASASVDPLFQQRSMLTPQPPELRDDFGSSVSLSGEGNTWLIGDPTWESDELEGGSYVGRTLGSGCGAPSTALELEGHNDSGDLFGGSVALSANGEVGLIGGGHGAWVFMCWSGQDEKLARRGPVALSANGSTALIGDAVFTRLGSTWTQQATLGCGESCGRDVALSSDGDTALIGGYEDNGAVGSAWVFTRSGRTWTEQAKLTGSGESGQGFGDSVALSSDGNTALIGASRRDRRGWNRLGLRTFGRDVDPTGSEAHGRRRKR